MNQTRYLTVVNWKDEEDRVVVYGNDPNYKIIAAKGSTFQIGQVIKYEPYGANFGFYIK